MHEHMDVFTWTAIMCPNLTTLVLGICDIIGMGQTLDFMCEHMVHIWSLDVVSLPTISADT